MTATETRTEAVNRIQGVVMDERAEEHVHTCFTTFTGAISTSSPAECRATTPASRTRSQVTTSSRCPSSACTPLARLRSSWWGTPGLPSCYPMYLGTPTFGRARSPCWPRDPCLRRGSSSAEREKAPMPRTGGSRLASCWLVSVQLWSPSTTASSRMSWGHLPECGGSRFGRPWRSPASARASESSAHSRR